MLTSAKDIRQGCNNTQWFTKQSLCNLMCLFTLDRTILLLVYTRNELASLAHSFYTCLKHQLMLALIIVLLRSTLDYVACMMLDPQL